MAQDASFDIVSKCNSQELDNAINTAMKEIENRFDFKGSVSKIEREGADKINLLSDDEFKLKSVIDILQGKLIKRGISLKFLEYGKVETALGGNAKQVITLKQGIQQEKAKEITKFIKDTKLKVRTQIQGDEIRVFGAKKDDLQTIIQLLRKQDFKIELQFANYR
ncbi:MAG: YajQ family cyclic di-GMP-binding protein [Candidatus Saganbacteria bacterium]|nr:YajQ family cyclic di-GMP-binding protein [Candidatus Saganbacteria bacterium]